jgi:hypothetical protein
VRRKPVEHEDGDGSQQHPCDIVKKVADDRRPSVMLALCRAFFRIGCMAGSAP